VKATIPGEQAFQPLAKSTCPMVNEVIRGRTPCASRDEQAMTEIFGVPLQAMLGQLLLGLVNGSFYATLSLGLAVIFGLLNIVNFAHGALYMMGAFGACLALEHLGIPYWVGAGPRAARRRCLRRGPRAHACFKHLYKLDRSVRAAADLRSRPDDRGRVPLRSSACRGSPIRCPTCCWARPTSAS
jgi:hypothetical protein